MNRINRNILMLVIALGASLGCANAQLLWNKEHLQKVKNRLLMPAYAMAYNGLLQCADSLLTAQPPSVMMKNKVAASGDKHDYLSQARYFWPDPAKPGGRPYIRKDGQSNPELLKLDRPRISELSDAVVRLSLAYYFSSDEKYARKAAEYVRTWFLDKKTRMNPHLRYAQMVPGQNNDLGRREGVLDTYSFVEMLEGVRLLEGSKSFTESDGRQLKDWFAQLLHWILTDKLGVDEYNSTNNHGTAYDVQVIAFADYVGDTATRDRFIKDVTSKRIDPQINSDGSQPQELKRTLGYGYSQYNLTHLLDILQMARNAGVEVGGNTAYASAKVAKGLDFLAAYLGKPVSAWQYKQINSWEEKQQELCKDLYRAALLGMKPTEYRHLYALYADKDFNGIFTLLYLDATLSDNGFASAQNQLRHAMECVRKARAVNKKELVNPRCLERDGSLRLVKPRDWCSGFFPGELWHIYMYTHNPSWQGFADSYTWVIEEMKDCRQTHDLGFVLYNSFGKAYESTGDGRYKDVVVQAARSLSTRYSDKVKAIRSWDHNKDKWRYPVIIDNMLNLELLFRASQITGDSTYRNIAVNHANTTMKNHFRKDWSSYHVVDYDPETGVAVKKNTHQGYSHESVWSRGQSWGLYGYTMCYRFTHDKAYLDMALKIYNYFFNLPGLPADHIPYWDMKDPKIPDTPRDASAAAVFASGLYELSTYTTGSLSAEIRREADRITETLYNNYRAKEGTSQGFLLLHSTGNYPSNDEIDLPICYADYYYLEALYRRALLE